MESAITLRHGAASYLRELQKQGKVFNTQRMYRWNLARFSAFDILAQKDVRKISSEDVARFISHYESGGKSKASVNQMKSCLSGLFRFLFKLGYIQSVPFAKSLQHAKVIRTVPKPLSLTERRALNKFARERTDVWLMLRFYLGKGLRLEEVRQLDVQDVVNQERIRILGKGGKARWIEVTPDLKKAIRSWLMARADLSAKRATCVAPEDHVALFISRFGRRFSRIGIQVLLKAYFRRAGLKDLTIQGLRHTFGQAMADMGVDLRAIQEMLGHAHLQTTQIYSPTRNKNIADAFRRAYKKGL